MFIYKSPNQGTVIHFWGIAWEKSFLQFSCFDFKSFQFKRDFFLNVTICPMGSSMCEKDKTNLTKKKKSTQDADFFFLLLRIVEMQFVLIIIIIIILVFTCNYYTSINSTTLKVFKKKTKWRFLFFFSFALQLQLCNNCVSLSP